MNYLDNKSIDRLDARNIHKLVVASLQGKYWTNQLSEKITPNGIVEDFLWLENEKDLEEIKRKEYEDKSRRYTFKIRNGRLKLIRWCSHPLVPIKPLIDFELYPELEFYEINNPENKKRFEKIYLGSKLKDKGNRFFVPFGNQYYQEVEDIVLPLIEELYEKIDKEVLKLKNVPESRLFFGGKI